VGGVKERVSIRREGFRMVIHSFDSFCGDTRREQVHDTSVPGKAKPTCGTFWLKRWRTPTAYPDKSG